MDSALEITWDKFNFDPQSMNILLSFDYGHWPHSKGVYFEVRIQYRASTKVRLFEAMNHVATLLETNS
jgi:hypothetical protein